MKIHAPLCITSRLLPGCRIGGVEISIEYSHKTEDGRQVYCWYIDTEEENFHSEDLKSKVGGGTLQEGLESLLGFLGAFAEAIKYGEATGQETKNMSLFPAELEDWALANANEIATLQLDLQEQQRIEE